MSFVFFINIDAMKRSVTIVTKKQSTIMAPELPKEIWLHIIACSTVKNKLRQTCSYIHTLASRKNKEIFLHDQLRLNYTDLKRFIIYYADLDEHLIVYNLLLHGANPDAQGDHGMSLMSYAIQNKNSNMIDILLKHPDISPHSQEQGKNGLAYLASTIDSFIGTDKSAALFFFAKKDMSAMIHHDLLSKISQQDKGKALVLATTYSSINVIRTLLVYQVNPNFISQDFRDNPLHIAARRGYTNILKLFVENGARIDDKNFYNLTPLHCAIRSGYINSTQFLIDQGASINTRGGNHYETSLLMAIKLGYIKIIELLLDNHVDINEKVSLGETALHYAVYYNRTNVVRKLLTYPDIQINIQNNKGETPLDIAIKNGLMDIAHTLFNNGGKSGLDSRWNQMNRR